MEESLSKERDLLDLQQVIDSIRANRSANEIMCLVSCLSHDKYYIARGSARSHELRKKYRKWLLRKAKKATVRDWI